MPALQLILKAFKQKHANGVDGIDGKLRVMFSGLVSSCM
jgi:hypothetical protein